MATMENQDSQKRTKIFHLIGGIISIGQLVGAIFLTPVQLVSTTGDVVRMTWDLQFSGSSVPNPNISYVEATSQLLGFDLSFLQPISGILIPQVLIIIAAGFFFVTLLLRIFEVPLLPFILGKLGSIACILVLLMVYAALTYSGALPLIMAGGIDYMGTLMGSFGLLLVLTGATSGLGA